MAITLDTTDSKILDLVQQEVPLVDRPYAAVGQRLGLDEQVVIDRLSTLRHGPQSVVRQISAIFDSSALGYKSTLVAAKVPEAKLDHAVRVINAHPGVSHNYLRNNAYNLWYTLAVPPDSRLGLQGTIDIVHRESGAESTRLMPTLKLFKIGVRLNLTGESAPDNQVEGPRFDESQRQLSSGFVPDDRDKRMIRVLQQDLAIEPRPFDAWAMQAQVTPEELFAAARQYERRRCMRRFSAVLKHREVGFGANGMGVWVVDPDRQEQFGTAAARFSAVSHCYLRPTYEDWPYNIFTMVHASSVDDCERVLAAISQATGVTRYSALYSSREFKKVRVKYFVGDIEAWEEEHVAGQ